MRAVMIYHHRGTAGASVANHGAVPCVPNVRHQSAPLGLGRVHSDAPER